MTHEISIRYDESHFPPRVFVSCKCGWEEYAGTSTREANRKFTAHAALENARQETARRCAEIAGRCVQVAVGMQDSSGRHGWSAAAEFISDAIRCEFGLDAEGGR